MDIEVRQIDLKDEPQYLTENEYQININGIWLHQRVRKETISRIPKSELNNYLLSGFMSEIELVIKGKE